MDPILLRCQGSTDLETIDRIVDTFGPAERILWYVRSNGPSSLRVEGNFGLFWLAILAFFDSKFAFRVTPLSSSAANQVFPPSCGGPGAPYLAWWLGNS